MKNEIINEIFAKMQDSSNLVALSQEDIAEVTNLGTETYLKPKKNVDAKGVLILLEGTRNLTMTKLGDMAEKITKPLNDNTKIMWSARINQDIPNDKLNVVYVY